MAYIYSLNNQAAVLDRRLQLGNEEWLRPLNINAASFLGVKVGVRYALTGVGKVLNAGFRIGLLSGISRPLRHPSGPVEYLGYSVWTASAAAGISAETGAPTYTASATFPSYFGGFPRLYSVIGTTNTILTSPSVNAYGGANYPIGTPQMFAFELIKTAVSPVTGSTIWTVNLMQVPNAPTAYCQHADFYFNMEAATGATFRAGITNVQTTGLTHAGPGAFDTLSISWNKSCPVLDIMDVAVLRTA
jgi:hypothetical protein